MELGVSNCVCGVCGVCGGVCGVCIFFMMLHFLSIFK
jgi:hypothetical protein